MITIEFWSRQSNPIPAATAITQNEGVTLYRVQVADDEAQAAQDAIKLIAEPSPLSGESQPPAESGAATRLDLLYEKVEELEARIAALEGR